MRLFYLKHFYYDVILRRIFSFLNNLFSQLLQYTDGDGLTNYNETVNQGSDSTDPTDPLGGFVL